jgi:hypothetical protein
MKSWIFLLCVSTLTFYDCSAQATQTPPATQPTPTTTTTTNRNSAIEQQRRSREVDDAFSDLRRLEISQTEQKPVANILSEEINPLYRNPSKKVLANLMPDKELLAQNGAFLRQPETGIFKLSGETNCAVNAKVVVATEKCLLNDLPGAGTAYSFRVKSHRMLHLSDLILENNVIKTDSVLQQGILVKLGNMNLNEVSSQTDGMKFLLDFVPAANPQELQKNNEILNKGIKSEGFIYAYGLYVENKTTYALRSIAYRGRVMRSISGVDYNEMDYDKRKDVIVAFTIIEREPNGSITVLWKLIQSKDSPKIELKKN